MLAQKRSRSGVAKRSYDHVVNCFRDGALKNMGTNIKISKKTATRSESATLQSTRGYMRALDTLSRTPP